MINERLKKIKVVAIIIALGSIVIAIATFYDAAKTLFTPLIKDKPNIIIDLGLASYDDKEVQKLVERPYDFRYIENPSGLISPTSSYLNGFYKERFIRLLEYGYYEPPSFTSVHYPNLDLKIVNNSDDTIVLDKIVIDVESSELDTKPLIYFYTGDYGDDLFCISLVNEGWGRWKSCLLNVSISAEEPTQSIVINSSSSYDQSIEVPYFVNKRNIDLSSLFIEKGVNVGFLKDQTINGNNITDNNRDLFVNALGPYSLDEWGDCRVYIYGNVTVYCDNDESISFSYIGQIALFMTGRGGGFEIHDKHNIMLKTSGKNYQIEYPVSLSLKPKEPERLLLTFAADKSSIHNFQVKLGNINNKELVSPKIKLELFMPRTSNQYLKNTK